MSTDQFQVSLKIAHPHPLVPGRLVPHAFVTIDGPGISPLIVGYYPQKRSAIAPGFIRNDGSLLSNTARP